MSIRSIKNKRWIFIIALAGLTVVFHYACGMSHVAVLEALHRRLCYVPIVLGGLWFGVYGGLFTATGISLAVTPFIVMHRAMGRDFISGEIVEVVFYLFIGWLTGTMADAQRIERVKNDDLKEQLRLSERLSTIGELFAYMMHEIKNPLSSIKGAVDIVADQTVEPARRAEFSGLLKSEISRLNTTLNSMLAYANMRLDLKACDMTGEINKIIGLISAEAEKNRVTVGLSSAGAVPAVIDCDRMGQVFINLILNAIDAMPGGGRLDITVRTTDTNCTEVLFADTGTGIPESDMNRLFKPFFTTKKNGSGLGLAISKRIVEEHRGRLLVESRPGKGTLFTVRLPCNP